VHPATTNCPRKYCRIAALNCNRKSTVASRYVGAGMTSTGGELRVVQQQERKIDDHNDQPRQPRTRLTATATTPQPPMITFLAVATMNSRNSST